MRRSIGQRWALLYIAPALLLVGTLAACGSSDDDEASGPPTVNFFSNPDNSGATQKAVDACNAASKGAYTISYQLLPSDSDGQHQQLARRLSARDKAVDVVAMDVNWTAEFAAAGWIKEWTGNDKDSVTNGTLAGAIASASYNDKLYGAPFNSNTQLLWYRKDVAPTPPATWDDMIAAADSLAAAGKPSYIEIQGAKYEGLVVWFNSLVSSAGGSILNDDGTKATVGDATLKAATIMKKLATSKGADPSLANTQEDQARLAFEGGKAAFELNYPFIYPSAQKNTPDLFKNLAWAPWPGVTAGTPAKVSIGGINLGIGSYTEHKDAAIAAVQCLRNADNQKVLAVEGGLPPTLTSLYDDQAVRAQYPFADDIRTELNNASVRPQTPLYPAVSLAIQNVLSPPASIDLATVNTKLESAINDALGSKGLQ